MSKLPLIRAVAIGLTGGARAMTPLAAVANAARTHRLPADKDAPDWLASPLVSAGATALAVYELVGDKRRSATDRVIPPAVVVRTINAAFAGAMIAPRKHRWAAATIAGGTAAIASWMTWRLRMRSMQRHSQSATGFIEDAVVVPTAIAAAAV